MEVDEHCSKIREKVLVFTSRDPDAEPAMAMVQDIGNALPPVLERLAGRYSPIRSKFYLI
jgi:hypothetical protein